MMRGWGPLTALRRNGGSVVINPDGSVTIARGGGSAVVGVDGSVTISRGGGSVVVNSDGSITVTPAGTTNVTLAANTLILPGGSAATPSLRFAASGDGSNDGIYWNSTTGAMHIVADGQECAVFLDAGLGRGMRVRSSGAVAWGSADNLTSSSDTVLARNAAGVLEVNNGTINTFRDLILRILRIGTSSGFSTLGTNNIVLLEGTAPSGTMTDGGALYVIDVAGVTQLRYIGSSGVVTSLS